MRFNLCVLLILICFSCSKNDRETYKYLKTFYDSEIEIPSNLMRINCGQIDYYHDWDRPFTYVVYHGPDA